jgi:hypothetical protein
MIPNAVVQTQMATSQNESIQRSVGKDFSRGMSPKKISIIFAAFLFLLNHHSVADPPVFSDQDCLECHGKPNLCQILSDGATRSLYVDPGEWSQDTHHISKLTCVDCHINSNPYLHFREGFIDVDCERCHLAEAEQYQRNVHFEYTPLSPGRELPLCYHCHTKHFVLRLDNPQSSVHENNIAETCGACHPEVMINNLISGSSLGKISGHRKGDISEPFDIEVCIHCHNPAHSITGVAKDFCVRCHDVDAQANLIIGPTHLNSTKWMGLNYLGEGLAIFLIVGLAVFAGYKSRKGVLTKFRMWLKSMEKDKQEPIESEKPEAPEEPGTLPETTGQEEPVKPEETPEPKQDPSSQDKEPE